MAPINKQAARKEQKKGKKEDDEPAVASTSSNAAILAAGKELVRGSVLAEVGQKLPQLMKKASTESLESKPNKEDNNEERNEGVENTDPDTSSLQLVTDDASSAFEGLTQRLSAKNPLGIDQTPDESWAMFRAQELDFGPHKRKKGNPARERIMVNFERNMAPYLHILLFLMCLRALLLRSWFSCLPWLVAYQFVSMYAPVNEIRDSIPKAKDKLPPIESKHRVAATMFFHTLIWLFLLYEFVVQTYIFEKMLLTLFFVGHAYVVAPIVDPAAARKAIAENNTAEPSTDTSTTTAKVDWGKVKAQVQDSVLFRRSRSIPELVKDIQASAKKSNAAQEKKDSEEEKTEEKEKSIEKPNAETNGFQEIQKEISPSNMLGLAKNNEEAQESWKTFKTDGMNFSLPPKKKGAAKERIVTNTEKYMFQYVNILLGLMCLRAFVFRSWFACLPLLVICQILSLKLPLAQVDPKVRSVATLGFHILVWLFFVWEAAFNTYVLEKVFLAGIFVGHAYIASN